jgi:hypothetical protein
MTSYNTSTTAFPTALDTLPDLPSSPDRDEAAVIALQTKVGIDSSTDATSLDYKVRRQAIALFTGADAPTLALTKTTGAKILTKGSAGAYTLAAPTSAEEGNVIKVIAGTAAAHTITATSLIDDGVTGGSKTTATFAAFIGASIELMAYNLKWVVISKNVVTIS